MTRPLVASTIVPTGMISPLPSGCGFFCPGSWIRIVPEAGFHVDALAVDRQRRLPRAGGFDFGRDHRRREAFREFGGRAGFRGRRRRDHRLPGGQRVEAVRREGDFAGGVRRHDSARRAGSGPRPTRSRRRPGWRRIRRRRLRSLRLRALPDTEVSADLPSAAAQARHDRRRFAFVFDPRARRSSGSSFPRSSPVRLPRRPGHRRFR